jgi:outer membrane protein TolC
VKLALAFLSAAMATLASAPAHAEPIAVPRTLTLSEAVALARDRAPMVREAFARIATADAVVDRTRATRMPALWAQGMGSAFTSNGQVYAGAGLSSGATTESYLLGQGTLNLQWALYDFGRTASSIDAARSGAKAARLTAAANEQIAMAEAAIAFFTLRADDAFLASTEEVRADRARVVAVTHRLVESGIRTPVDEARANVGLEVAELEVSVAQASRESDAVSLASALLLDPATTFQLVAPGEIRVDDDVARDEATAVRDRREVAAGVARVEQARREVDFARRTYLPSLGVLASGTVQYTDDRATADHQTNVVGSPAEYAQGTVTLTIPIVDPSIHAGIEVAEGGLDEALANLERLKQGAQTEAARASTQVKSARLVVTQSERLAVGSGANLAAMEERYTSGMESPLALADAQREDAIARVAVVRARLALDLAKVRLLAGLSRARELLAQGGAVTTR